MSVYIVTYDLNRETSRPNITKKIKEWDWARLSESSYAIDTTLTVEGVFNALKPLIDANDNLYVITLKKPWTGYGPPDVNEWLEKHLPR